MRVRLIRISQANDFCPGLIVRAAERTLPHTSAKKVAGSNMCAFTSDGVAAALKAAASQGDPSDSADETIVATCAAAQKEFDFPYPVDVDLKLLKRSNPKVSNLWDTFYQVYRRTFGAKFSFNGLTSEQEQQIEQFGTQLLPDLTSGKYQLAYAGTKCGDHDCDNYLAWRLQGYTQAPQPYDPFAVTLVDSAELHLTNYVPPIMPPLAKMARIQGDVRLHMLVDPQSGLVKNVEALSGHALLQQAAIKAAQSWQFAPEASSTPSVEATLRFELRCR